MRFLTFILLFTTVHLYSQSPEAQNLLDSGYYAYQNGEFSTAVDYFQKSIDLDASNAETHYLKGVCLSQQSLNIAAIKSYDKALKINPDYAEVYFEKGYSHFSLNQFEKAIIAFDKAIELKPDYAVAWFNRGSVKCIIGKKEEAVEDWKKAEELGASIPNLECE